MFLIFFLKDFEVHFVQKVKDYYTREIEIYCNLNWVPAL